MICKRYDVSFSVGGCRCSCTLGSCYDSPVAGGALSCKIAIAATRLLAV